MTIRITILNGPDKDSQVQIEGDATIGRSQDCELTLREGTVSRQHARLVSGGSGTVLEKVSEKGVLKCDGKAVKKVLLKHRQRVQCGAVLLLVEDLNKKSTPKSVPSRRLAPVQDDASGLPEKLDQQLQGESFDQEQTQVMNYIDEKPKEEEADLEPARKFSPKLLIQFGALILLVLVGWQVFSNIEPAPVPQLVFPYKAGEEKLIDLSAYYKRYKVRSPSGLGIDRGDLVRAQLDPFSILRFKTLGQGDAVLSLLGNDGRSQLDLKLMIRGKVEPTAQSIDFQLLPEEQKIDRARTLMDQGRLVNRDNAYQAFLHYRQALDILESVSTTHPLYLQCREDMKAPKRAFESRLERLWAEADRHRKNKTYDRALVLVEEILSMVGDSSQLDYQRAQIYRKHILLRLPKK